MPPNSLQHLPLGQRFPDSPHAVCVSLPTMADVIGYEEKDPETHAAMKSGYPRFKLPGMVAQLRDHIAESLGNPRQDVVLVTSKKAAEGLLEFLECPDAQVVEHEDHTIVHFPTNPDVYALALKFLQHTGSGISSRQAEDLLLQKGLISNVFPETMRDENPEQVVKDTLTELTSIPQADILLCNSGMNAFYAAFLATAQIQRQQNRTVWIQLGWLYLDTSEILKKFLQPKEQVLTMLDVFDIEGLEQVLVENAGKVAAIVTEAPTNPLIQTPDLPKIYELARQHGVALIADPTSSTPANLNLLPHADVLANSLTKYAANQGDVLAGAVYFNPESPFYAELKERTPQFHEPPYLRDLQRLAHEIQNYDQVLQQINWNTLALAEYLEQHPTVKQVHWAYAEDSKENYIQLSTKQNAPGGLITIDLNGPMQPVHDKLRLLKSPSFGTTWSMICPFMYLAHYDLVSTSQGKAFLHDNNINPELLRISVGSEPIEPLMEVFDEALGVVRN